MLIVYGLLLPEGQPSIASFVATEPRILLRFLPDFEGHSVASDVLRELFKTIEVCFACQAKLVDLSKNISPAFLPAAFSPHSRDPAMPATQKRQLPIHSHSAKNQNNRTPVKLARSTRLLLFRINSPEISSIAVAWVWVPAGPRFKAICRSNTWTALRLPPSIPWPEPRANLH